MLLVAIPAEVTDWRWVDPRARRVSLPVTPSVFSPWLVLQLKQLAGLTLLDQSRTRAGTSATSCATLSAGSPSSMAISVRAQIAPVSTGSTSR